MATVKKMTPAARRRRKKTQKEFSKVLLVQESALIWIVTIAVLILSFIGISRDYLGELPWLAAMVGFPWSAYGISQAYYYKKSLAENTKNGIKYESVIRSLGDAGDDEDEEPKG